MTNEKRVDKKISGFDAVWNTAVITKPRVSSILREFYLKNNVIDIILVRKI